MNVCIGFKKITSKKDGSVYYDIFYTYDDKFVNGQACDHLFTAASNVNNVEALTPGAVIDVIYNRFGRAERVSVL